MSICSARVRNARRTNLPGLCVLSLLVLAACSGDDQSGTATPASGAAPPSTAGQTGTAAEPRESAAPPPAAAAEEPAAPTAIDELALPVPVDPEYDAAAEVAAPTAAPVAASPTRYEIRGVGTRWDPMVLFVRPGDQIVFRQMIGHDTESIDELIPAGAEGWRSQLGEEGFSITLDVPGAYVYKCNPHVSMGMLGAIVVGEVPPANLEAITGSALNKGMVGRTIRKLEAAVEAH